MFPRRTPAAAQPALRKRVDDRRRCARRHRAPPQLVRSLAGAAAPVAAAARPAPPCGSESSTAQPCVATAAAAGNSVQREHACRSTGGNGSCSAAVRQALHLPAAADALLLRCLASRTSGCVCAAAADARQPPPAPSRRAHQPPAKLTPQQLPAPVRIEDTASLIQHGL